MLILDVNILVNAVHRGSPIHAIVKDWLNAATARGEKIALPWFALVGFVRVITNKRITTAPYSIEDAMNQILAWLSLPNVSVLHPGPAHVEYFSALCREVNASGNLVSDAHLAAMAIEHDGTLISNDADFGRFPGLRWTNPAP